MAAFMVITAGERANCCPAGSCTHRDCAANHEQVAAICPACDETIGYDTFYVLVDMVDSTQYSGVMPVHQDCYWRAHDEAADAGRSTIFA